MLRVAKAWSNRCGNLVGGESPTGRPRPYTLGSIIMLLPTRRRRRTCSVVSCIVVLSSLVVLVASPRVAADDAAATSATSGEADPSGETMPVGDRDGWRQVFTDDFTTDVKLGHFPGAVAAKWDVYASPIKDTFGHGTYSPGRVVSVDNGVLNEHIHSEHGVFMVAALLPQVPGSKRQGQTYGRYAVRFKTDRIEGYKLAWLLWPDSRVWPRDGEIDFPERNLVSDSVLGFVHHQGARRGSDQASASAPFDSTKWHTAIIEWSPNLVVFSLDGGVIDRITERVPNTPMHWVIQTETTLTSTVPPVSAAGNVQIDWVAAWQYDPTAVTSPVVAKPPSPSPAPDAVPRGGCPRGAHPAGESVRQGDLRARPRYKVYRS